MRKKFIAILVAACTCACMAMTAFAAKSVSFYVDGVRVFGDLSIYDASNSNPFAYDSVTATATADSVMDTIFAEATIYYACGDMVYSNRDFRTSKSAKSCEVTVRTGRLFSVGFKGYGDYSAERNGNDGSGTTEVNW